MVKVSAVISTYNEEKNIGRVIRSCLQQTYPHLEIIVIDSWRSTDRTAEIAEKLSARVYKFGRERSQQRNYGVSLATGKFVLILDADMVLASRVVAACVAAIRRRPRTKAVIIPEQSFGDGYWAACKALERNCYLGDDSIEAARFFDRKTFLALGGFRRRMISGEDWDLHRRFKSLGSPERANEFIYHYEGQLTLWSDVKKKLYYSRTSAAYIRTHVSGVGDVAKFIFRPAFIRNWKKLISDPIHLPGLFLMKFSEFTAGGLAIVTQRNFWSKIIS